MSAAILIILVELKVGAVGNTTGAAPAAATVAAPASELRQPFTGAAHGQLADDVII